MRREEETFRNLASELGYDQGGGLVSEPAAARTGTRRHLMQRVKRHLPGIDAVYFAADTPLVYFARRPTFDPEAVCALHRRVWNDARVPLLVVVTPVEVRVYDTFARPTRDATRLDEEHRLVRPLTAATDDLAALRKISRPQLETGEFWTSLPTHFTAHTRCDQSLLDNLEATAKALRTGGLKLPVAHQLLTRTILLLYLEHRRILLPAFYENFVPGAATLPDVLVDHAATYRLFDALAGRLNGDLLPAGAPERETVRPHHLRLLGQFLSGRVEVETGQMTLWPLYDFSVIPIQLVSAIYESFLHTTDDKDERKSPGARGKQPTKSEASGTRPVGAHYTPHFIVELVMNEVLPWPGPADCDGLEEPRVLDPCCGSGVFLVEAFRRIVERWRACHPDSQLTSEFLCQLMTNCIFGIDRDATAVCVAAFSLYIALLEYLEPLDIWDDLKLPNLTKRCNGQPSNLEIGDAFDTTRGVHRRVYHLVVGNPPWKRNYLPESAHRYCQEHAPHHPVAKEIAHAFMWLASDRAVGGTVAMLCTSKWLVNREKPDVLFRRAFFARNGVQTVINLSAFRRVRGNQRLFASAVAPATVVVWQPGMAAQVSPSILYCTPKPRLGTANQNELVIEGAELKWLPRVEATARDDLWKVLMWGTWRDLDLVRKLAMRLPLKDFIKNQPGWSHGRGFQPGTDLSSDLINSLPFVEASDVTRFHIDTHMIDRPFLDGRAKFFRTGTDGIYNAPHVLIKEGQREGRFCAAFVPVPCTFRDTITGISAPKDDAPKLKALTAFLNSSLATYLLFLSGGTWGVERERAKKGEVLSLPGSLLERDSVIRSLAKLVDDVGSARTSAEVRRIERMIDEEVLSGFDLTASERVLVEVMTSQIIDYAQRGDQSPAAKAPALGILRSYAQTYTSVLNRVLRHRGLRLRANVYMPSGPLCVISFERVPRDAAAEIVVQEIPGALDAVLMRLDRELLGRESHSIYVRRHLRMFDHEGLLHVVKASELRFWTQSAAFNDADATIAEATFEGERRGIG